MNPDNGASHSQTPGPIRRLIDSLLDPQVAVLWIIGLILMALILYLGGALTPFFVAVVLAYMLEGMVRRLTDRRLPRWAAVLIVFTLFFATGIGLVVWLIPMVIDQLTALVAALPSIAQATQKLILELHTRYATDLDPTYIENLIPRLTLEIEELARKLVSQTLTFLPSLFNLFLYLILVPFLVLLFLKDKQIIVGWLSQFVPAQRKLFTDILTDIDLQMSRFFRGKFWEMAAVSVVTIVAFLILKFHFAVLMGLIAGVSVVIPYIGVAAATIPIVLVALFQFGFSAGFWKVVIAFAVIQLIDGNLLAPLLLGNMIRIHPTAIVFALLICGHLWGFWGVLLALPVAIVVKSILDLSLPYLRRRAESQEAAGEAEE